MGSVRLEASWQRKAPAERQLSRVSGGRGMSHKWVWIKEIGYGEEMSPSLKMLNHWRVKCGLGGREASCQG